MVFERYNTTYIIFPNLTVITISFCTAIINYHRYIAKMMRSSTFNLFFTADILVHSPLVQYIYYQNINFIRKERLKCSTLYIIYLYFRRKFISN